MIVCDYDQCKVKKIRINVIHDGGYVKYVLTCTLTHRPKINESMKFMKEYA